MSLYTEAQDALAEIIAAETEATVTVVNGDNTAVGVRDIGIGDADLDDGGERGMTTGRVYCNADTIGALTVGKTITVDGAEATVMRFSNDPANALVEIEYQLRKPK
jgi:endonuclease V-like protein UPF0215 family